jgi:4-hydroxy-tetrahydrodipicolinate synthase
MHRSEAKDIFSKPIPSIRTPFGRDGSIDFAGLAKVVDRCIENKYRAIMLTAGDSHWACLSESEIAEVTQAVCRQVKGRASVIAADRYLDTTRAVEFAGMVRELGASTVMVMPPDWAASCTPHTLAEHYAAVAKVLPVTLVTNVFIPRGIAFGLETVERALSASDRIVAIKDDMGGVFAQRMCMAHAGTVAIYSGGQKLNHLGLLPFGAKGYLSTFATLHPAVTAKYWSAIERGDRDTALAVVREIDAPYFDHLMTYTGGFDAGMHGMMELAGLCGRWRRKPYYSLSDEEMEKLADFRKGIVRICGGE